MPLNTPFLAGFTPEFMGRRDGYLGLRDVYKLSVPTVVVSDAIMYQAVDNKKLDIISGSSTDGRLKAFGLKVLQDDKHIFPPYYAAPIIRQEVLREHPELREVLNTLSGLINDSIMTELNYRVDHLHRLPEEVAKEFLKENKLLREVRSGKKGNFIIGSKLYGDGYILAAMYASLVDGYTELRAVTRTGLGGTKICFEALLNKQIDMYPEYTGTGLLVILNTAPSITDTLMSDSQKVYEYVKARFEKNYGIEWLKPIGFNNTYALMMRKKQAENLGINSISDLALSTANEKK